MRLSVLVWALAAAPVAAQAPRAGPHVHSFRSSVDDTDQFYSLRIPPRYDPSKRYPLLISLHGQSTANRLSLRRLFHRGDGYHETDAEAGFDFAHPPEDFFWASPLGGTATQFPGLGEKDLDQLLEDLKRRFALDEDRIYLSGVSTGGDNALYLALTRPDVWAAVAVVSSIVGAASPELAPNLKNLPLRLFHGARDPVAPVETSRAWHKRLVEAGALVEYTEYPLLGHNVWETAVRQGGVMQWLAANKRNRFPASVSIRTRQYKYASAYWVEITALSPGELAVADAEFVAPNQIRIHTERVRGLRLHLAGHPLFTPQKPLEITIDGERLRCRDAVLSRIDGRWKAQPSPLPAGAKRAGQEGPLLEAFLSRHIFVYGVEGPADADEIQRRRDQAAAAALWSSPRWRSRANVRIASDREVTESEMQQSNLILFGTRETNALIRRLSPQAPFELHAGAADYGLLYIWPYGDRLVVINSGLPFYTGADAVRRGGYRFPGPGYRLLATFPDFLLFKGSLENVIVEGRFDSHWGLAEPERSKLEQSRAVRLR